MKSTVRRALVGAAAFTAATPTVVVAHPGHAGDHGFLYAALQPLLSLDHFLAGLIVAAAGALVFAVAARLLRTSRRTRRS
jgi:hydrogenase/urease accessory protein HupE